MINYLKAYLKSMIKNEEGQGLVEYALILVLIAIVVIAALTTLGTDVEDIFTKIGNTLST